MKMNFTAILGLTAVLSISSLRAEIDYLTDVAPLLRDYCAGCHNEGDLEGEFSVETFASLMKGGETGEKKILVPGKPVESFFLQTVAHTAKPVMPPKREPQPSKEEIEVLRQWIAEGAKGPEPGKDLSILSTLNVPSIAAVAGNPMPISAMEVSPDGKLTAIARFGHVEIREQGSGKTVRKLAVEDGKVNAVHFSPDGKTLVAAAGITGLKGVAILWDVASGKVIQRIGEESHRDILFDAELSPDGKRIATAGYDRIIRLWEVETGKYLREFPSHNGAVFDLAFSPDGKVLASASADSTCKIWQVETGTRLDTLNQPQGEQFRVSFTRDGKFIVGVGADNRIRLWRFLSKEKPRINPVIHARFGHEDEIVEMALSNDGKWLVTASADRALKQWTLPDLQPAGVYQLQPDVVSGLAFLPGARVATARLDGSVETLSMPSENSIRTKAVTSSPTSDQKMIAVKGDMPAEIDEAEGSDPPVLAVGMTAKGVIGSNGDVDSFVFPAKKGEEIIFETNAARAKSALDSHLSVYDSEGRPVERVVLQAMRDSWLTFRGKDSVASGDFRVHNWREMELNEYLYVNGEVVKLWHFPRGPDSGFLVYPGFGTRHNYFGTSGLAHPLGQPCYIVRALPAGSEPSPNGLPVYQLYFENDDDSMRELGKDSKLTFVAPTDGTYELQVRDVRGFGGKEFHYKVTARIAEPDFSISVAGKDPKVSPGSGREIMYTAKRVDGFSGPIRIEVTGLPKGLVMPKAVSIEQDQYRAFTTIHAASDFKTLTEEQGKKIQLTAIAKVNGKEIRKPIGDLGKVEAGPAAKVIVEIESDGASGQVGKDGVLEFTVAPGETMTARVVAQRLGFKERIDFGKEDSGRNLPHGVYVDNIGLNGLMIPVGKSEQRFFVTAAKGVPDTTRLFHLRTTADGKQVSKPVRIKVQADPKLVKAQ